MEPAYTCVCAFARFQYLYTFALMPKNQWRAPIYELFAVLISFVPVVMILNRKHPHIHTFLVTTTCTCQAIGLDYFLCQCPVVSREEGKPEVLSAIAVEFRK